MAADRLSAEYDVQLTWMPFELNPSIPADGWRLPARITAMHADPDNPLARRARELGLPPMVMRDRVYSSRLALEATEVAREHGVLTRFHHAVAHRYWALGQPIHDLAVLAEAAAEVGLDAAVFKDLVLSGRSRGRVDGLIQEAHAAGIRAVPTYVFAGRYGLSGAQPFEAFASVMAELGVTRRPGPGSTVPPQGA